MKSIPCHFVCRKRKRSIFSSTTLSLFLSPQEIHPDLIDAWSTLISQPKPSSTIQQAQQLTYIKYTAPTPPPATPHPSPPRTVITSESRGLILAAGTTGFRTWEAALHLATYLSTPAGEALVAGKRVIELGAGTGLVSMFCAAYLRPRSVLATDREPALIENIRDCARRSLLPEGQGQGQFGAAVWEWGTPLGGGSDDGGDGDENRDPDGPATQPRGDTNETPVEFDVALGADLIYDTDLIPLLISTLHDLFKNYGIKEFVIAATLRNQETFRTFLDACEENRLRTDQVPFESPPPEEQTGFFHSTEVPIRMYRITQKEDQ
ncbi:hypothetical protein P170DRAFT_437179 [Aspergillus steynii IBT 23096]|uniref:Methyltransferase-domain-containing protein n=1 Tax=Aspergillus steynii IBT 23096 TaxID=1392250 RepID=A0A2I2G9N9_9EURO|nr:uncharacterized protein P170DRAFT_437179 [Aspergillus steynii IBT 23096]PLB49596.1 hypothetical protein P170DRAFT_437179 [Aspergillus steynii IBT 23096]